MFIDVRDSLYEFHVTIQRWRKTFDDGTRFPRFIK